MRFKRIFIEKKEEFNTEAELLLRDFKDYLKVQNLSKVRVVNVYDLINAGENEEKLIIENILFEDQLDKMYEDKLPIGERESAFRVELLRGQFNQREDSTNKLVEILIDNDQIKVKNSKIIVLENVNEEEVNKIKEYYINPIEMRERDLEAPHYEEEGKEPGEVEVIESFINMGEEELANFRDKYSLGMDMEDLSFCQNYFKKEENRNPSITELKLIDTYWSDHCRHTTFMTEITDISLLEGKYREVFQETLNQYLESRQYVYGDKNRPISLMDLATINMKEVRKKGLLDDKEETDEVNACSIEIDVDVDGKMEKWLLMFKNETHNHPTEMEPFGGAATCLGGAIRDPLSGRSYVYQAMRISGSADPRERYEDTLAGKLPQRKITQGAKKGYSSYGYEIGAATGYIREIYDPGYKAKRMELGALVAAAPKEAVYRGKAEPGDLIILVGGRTGRDGLGGAVGSSRQHTEDSLESSGAEVQKGNPAMERKIIRLFRKKEVSKMIKVCNDFGAGGVSVAIGELADGLLIDLDKVPLKYPGLDGSEIALSESQERMAVVINPKDLETFMAHVAEEDVEGQVVAQVTEENRLKMLWRGRDIVNISRDFLDTNGVRKKAVVEVLQPEEELYFDQEPSHIQGHDIKKDFISNMKDLNISSQRGLVEGFDHSVEGGTVLMPLGGKDKLTPIEGMVAKIPVLEGRTTSCSLMTYGYEPKLSKWSPFHGGYYAVIESLAKLTALGGDYRKARLTFQEYFERLGEEPSKWGKPFSALLGAFRVQKALDIPSIGGKDSMSGSFEDLDVPPTLVSFAVTTDRVENIISPEFKKPGSIIGLVRLKIDEDGMIDFKELESKYKMIKEMVDKGQIVSASTVKYGGIARSIGEMCLGNKIGFEFNDIDRKDLFKPYYGSIIVEVNQDSSSNIDLIELGRTSEKEKIIIAGEEIDLEELRKAYEEPLEEVFPVNRTTREDKKIEYKKGSPLKWRGQKTKPRILIPVFTGSHGEYTMARSFEKAGGQVDTFVFKSLTRGDREESYRELARRIKECQIIGLPDGALLGDEPETGGKLLKLIFSNPYVREELDKHIEDKEGLILGVGAGLLGLVKLGLIGEGISVAHNKDDEFISRLVDVRVNSNLSPWFSQMEVGDIYTVPVATKEGRILGDLEKLLDKGQVASSFHLENPTGSLLGAEGLTDESGRILATVSSIDRLGEDLYKNIEIVGSHKIFEAGIKYFG